VDALFYFFPEERNKDQSASRKGYFADDESLSLSDILKNNRILIFAFKVLTVRRWAIVIFTVFSGNCEKILSIQ
jgi:hypothetical protein